MNSKHACPVDSMKRYRHGNPMRPGLQSGVSMVELLVAMVIGMFLVGAVAVLYVSTATGSRASTIESQMNEDAALALELLQQQIRLAGFSLTDASDNRLFSGRSVFACDKGFAANNTAKFSDLACNTTGTAGAALAVRYQATLLNSQTITTGGVTRPANCAYSAISDWTPTTSEGAATDTTSLALADNRYYIANDADNNNTPTLYCLGRTGAALGTATALIPGIQSMDLRFGVTLAPAAGEPLPHQITAYLTADDVAALSPANSNLAWSRVAAVRICLLARSAQPVPLGGNTTADIGGYKDCSGTSQTSSDRFLRRAYVTTIFLRNMRPAVPSAYATTTTGGATTAVNPWAYLTEE